MPDDTAPDDAADEQSLDEAPAAVHRQLGDAGARISEAHAHLSGVRSQRVRDDLSEEVARAEAQALVESLEAAREHIDAALAQARTVAPEAAPEPDDGPDEEESDDPDPPAPETPDETTEDDDTDAADDTDATDDGTDDDEDPDRSRMLWNTVPADVRSRP